ncbi:MAG: helix-turn-helix domain-containing protein [Lachnospiraceae bacterium]
MCRKSKIDTVKKVEIVEQCLNGEFSRKGDAKMCGVNERSIQDWIRIYKTDGPESLLSPKTNKRCSKELKLQAVHAYLSEKGTFDEICVKFGIRQHSQLSSWIKAYNEGKE